MPRMQKSKQGVSHKQISVQAILLGEKDQHLPTYVDKIRSTEQASEEANFLEGKYLTRTNSVESGNAYRYSLSKSASPKKLSRSTSKDGARDSRKSPWHGSKQSMQEKSSLDAPTAAHLSLVIGGDTIV